MAGSDSSNSCGDARREKCVNSGASSMRSKRSRRSKYTAKKYLIMFREVAATKAHIAPCGRTLELFKIEAEKVNRNTKFTVEATAKGMSHQYTRVKKDFNKSERKIFFLSGVRGETVVGNIENVTTCDHIL